MGRGRSGRRGDVGKGPGGGGKVRMRGRRGGGGVADGRAEGK